MTFRPTAADLGLLILVLTLCACGGRGRGAASRTTLESAPTHASIIVAAPGTTPAPEDDGATRAHTAPAESRALAPEGCTLPHGSGEFLGTAGGREYRLHVPRGYSGIPAPLVLNFHGYAQEAAQQEAYSGLVPLSDEAGFILVTPEGGGSPQGWAIAGIYNDDGTDEVAVARETVAMVGAELCIDADRIFATGHSNGGEMAAQLACFAPDLVAAVAPVSGVIYQGCTGQPTPLISFQGTYDDNVAYEDTVIEISSWAAHNQCDGSGPRTEDVSEHVRRETWEGCEDGADVVFYVIDGGGHTWPGAVTPGGAGPVTMEIDASRIAWEFFATHPRKRP